MYHLFATGTVGRYRHFVKMQCVQRVMCSAMAVHISAFAIDERLLLVVTFWTSWTADIITAKERMMNTVKWQIMVNMPR